MWTIDLGDEVKDRISGLSGIVVARTEWLYGCERVTIQPREHKDGKPAENFCVDAAQCEVITKGAIASYTIQAETRVPLPALARPAGDRPSASRPADPTR